MSITPDTFFYCAPTVCQGCRMDWGTMCFGLHIPSPAPGSRRVIPGCVQGRCEEEGYREPVQLPLHPVAVPVHSQPSLPLVGMMPDRQSHAWTCSGTHRLVEGRGSRWGCAQLVLGWPRSKSGWALSPSDSPSPDSFSGSPPLPQASFY